MAWPTLNWRWPFGQASTEREASVGDDGASALQPIAFAIDDEVGITRFIATALGSFGIETLSIRSAGAAITALKSRTPAVIFLDVTLEGSDAVDVIRGLGEIGYCGTVQLMSGSDVSILNDVKRVGERHRLNMLPPLQKPFRLDAIRQIVKTANLDGRQVKGAKLDKALGSALSYGISRRSTCVPGSWPAPKV